LELVLSQRLPGLASLESCLAASVFLPATSADAGQSFDLGQEAFLNQSPLQVIAGPAGRLAIVRCAAQTIVLTVHTARLRPLTTEDTRCRNDLFEFLQGQGKAQIALVESFVFVCRVDLLRRTDAACASNSVVVTSLSHEYTRYNLEPPL
jgi:hypothetical protein